MLEEFTLIGTRDRLVPEFRRRCGGLYSTVLLDLPASVWEDDDWIRETVAELKRG